MRGGHAFFWGSLAFSVLAVSAGVGIGWLLWGMG